ncbi:hypothetical protein INS49_013421 [Diaporthe citri]|uniref:uncharacterized protein n=1 Tax=Diaporthe citri TaxID=83186 RepID=UPI001C81F2EB|nr:uncharacterized protein INS49_013421 [Diaporthe citri]KAG6357544.1 hypothetical protein INS49_013421 [Diaporthe citri]
MMKLIQWEAWGPLDANNPRDAAYWQIQVRLNPMYEAYIPTHLKAHRSSLKKLWKTVGFDLSSMAQAPLVLTQQEFREVGLVEDLPSNTHSKETWTTVEGWLRECSEKHHCLANTNQNWYPTRLVEVLSDDMFRIVRSDSSSFERGRGYVTLSHRWGNGDFARLTTENLSALEKGQPVAMLRLIFREALVVAQRMNIPYIWIDSLCIIQAGDDFADWRRESTTMAEVYSNSRCNISADWGDDDHGLFFERDPPYDRPCSLQLRLKSPESGDDTLSKSTTTPDAVPACIILPYRWTEDIMESPINRRGWVVQERQLAPRVLHFSPQQVSWECCEKVTFEKVPLNFMGSRRTRSRLVHELDPNSVQRKRMKRLQLHNPQKAVDWPRIVAHYSACGLTKQQDVLVAIAGIARRLCPVVKDLYVTGLWANRVPPLPDPHSQLSNTSACPSTHLEDPGIQLCRENGTVLEVHNDRAAREGDARADSTIYYYAIIEHSIVHPIMDPVSAQYPYNHATGLFLRSVDASMGRFERVGRVEYFRARGAADILEPLGNERDLPAWSYDETTGEHTFYIV